MTPSNNLDRLTALASRRGFLALLLAANALLIGHIARLPTVAVGILLVALVTWLPLRRHTGAMPMGALESALRTAALGGLGMLVGLAIDAGAFGALGLIALCNASHVSMPGMDAVARHIYFMPAASIGMLAGCLQTMPLSCFARPAARCAEHAGVLAGMLYGMLCAENVAQRIFAVNSTSVLVAGTLILMLLGMFAGTVGVTLLTRGIARAMAWFTERTGASPRPLL